jgi:hypothetical protein
VIASEYCEHRLGRDLIPALTLDDLPSGSDGEVRDLLGGSAQPERAVADPRRRSGSSRRC